MDSADKYLSEVYLASFNDEFKVAVLEEGSAFVPVLKPFGLQNRD